MTGGAQDLLLRRYVALGALVIVLFFGVLGGWATFSQLASAAIAPGELGFSTDRKTIQHLEGGIVAEIPVKDGDVVNPGDILIRLDRTQPQAIYDQVKARYYAILATEARLRAERDGAESGRIYSIDCDVTDYYGNSANAGCVVVVPHDRRKAK